MSAAVDDFMMYRAIAKRIMEVKGIMSEDADKIWAELYKVRERMTEEEIRAVSHYLGSENR